MHFVDAKMIAGTGPNESINLDTPDPVTKGFQWKWSAQDRTPNHDITIRNNDFTNVNVAIGTHQYSQDRPHTAVRILNNVIDGTKDHAISMMNWNQPVIQYNTIRNVHRARWESDCYFGTRSSRWQHQTESTGKDRSGHSISATRQLWIQAAVQSVYG